MNMLYLTLGLFAILVSYGVIAVYLDNRRLKRLADERIEESICTFGRSLDFRRLDTKVIRAVYEELQQYFDFLKRPLPLRPNDRFNEDLKMDHEDLEDLAEGIALRCGRTFDSPENNPFYGKVTTVSDLVEFICNQPQRSTHEAEQAVGCNRRQAR